MTRTWIAACSAIIGCATAAITAQTPAPPQSSTSNEKRITVTGCLAAAPSTSATTSPTGAAGTTGTAGAAGTAGTTGTAPSAAEAVASASKFQLTNATAASSTDAASTAETPDAPKASSGQTYQLIANPTALSAHVGKKLELTGTLEDQPSATTGAESKGPALKVESGKVIAESCPQ